MLAAGPVLSTQWKQQSVEMSLGQGVERKENSV